MRIVQKVLHKSSSPCGSLLPRLRIFDRSRIIQKFPFMMPVIILLILWACNAVHEALQTNEQSSERLAQRIPCKNFVSSSHVIKPPVFSSLLETSANIPGSEMQALYDLYESTGGPNWKFWESIPPLPFPLPVDLSHYNFGVPWNFTPTANPCTDHWQGVNCTYSDAEQMYHVDVLHLTIHNLVGPVPDSIGQLTELTTLSLPYNKLNGTIPLSLCELSNLAYIDVDTNEFTGTIPPCLGTLTELQYLFLYKNRLTGQIPESLGNLQNLLHLGLNVNKLNGTIPMVLGTLLDLQYIDFDSNFLVGHIPESFGNLTQLLGLNIASNKLSGSLPESVGNLPLMLGLYLNNNSLTGTIPSSLENLNKLQYIVLDTNKLSGTIPAGLGQMQQLEYLGLNHNYLVGSIPTEVSYLPALKVLLLQDNAFTGSLLHVFNRTFQTSLQSIALNDNQLTGQIPGELFLLPSLTSFVAVGNCFHGELPRQACDCTSMVSLVLDGLSSATSCRNNLLPSVSQSYIIDHAVTGKLPQCVFQLPNLTTLHLSGNGFSGSFAADLVLSSALIDLTLSHNELTGSIPESIQERQWHNLDLSYNRFSGSLLSSFGSVPLHDDHTPADTTRTSVSSAFNYSDTSLSLENNRLSGVIPDSILKIRDVSVLGSNVFACSIDDDNLPAHDSGRSNYQCGSTAFNIPYFLWLSLTAVIITCCCLLYLTKGILQKYVASTISRDSIQQWLSYTQDGNPDTAPYANFARKMDLLSSIAGWSTFFIVIVLLPLYAGLSHDYGTLTHQYAWTISAAYLEGWVPVALMLPILMCMLVMLLFVYLRKIRDIKMYSAISRETIVAKGQAAPDRSTMRNFAVYFMYILINMTIVVGVNVAYVYVAIYEANSLLPVAQVLLSLFKLVWNSVGTTYLLKVTVGVLSCGRLDGSEETKYSETHSVFLQVFVAQLNNIVIPCLVVALISPNCFYSVFVAAPDVDSQYFYEYCELFTPTGVCVLYTPKLSTTSYDPPFTYSYQCSSSLITYYAPAFVLLCLVNAFLTPAVQLLTLFFYRRAEADTRWFALLDMMLPAILKPVPSTGTGSADSGDSHAPLRDTTTGAKYFTANRILLTLMTYLGMLLTFGAMFPPLAVSLAVTMLIIAYFAKLKAGRFLHSAVQQQRTEFVAILMRECQGVGSSAVLQSSIWLLVTISCCFYTLFLFDTLGGKVGIAKAFWVLVVVPLLPAVMYIVYYICDKMQWLPWQGKHTDSNDESYSESAAGSERHTNFEMTSSESFKAGATTKGSNFEEISTVHATLHRK